MRQKQTATLDTKMQKAAMLQRQGKLRPAIKLCRQVLRTEPRHYRANFLMGVIAHQRKQLEQAETYFSQALGVRPDEPDVVHNHAVVLRELGRCEEALAQSDRLMELKPDFLNGKGLINRGDVLRELNRPEEALACYDRALTINERSVYALLHRGTSLRSLYRHEEALACYDRAMALTSELRPVLLVNRGYTLVELERLEDALSACEEALSIAPDYSYAHFTMALVCLLLGDYSNGFKQLEWRPSKLRIDESGRFKCAQWVGEKPVAGKTILLHADQGLGDTIQFCRYADAVAALDTRVILEVQPHLKSLLANMKGVDTIIAIGEKPPPFDLHCPLMSLPLALGTTIDTIPAAHSYLKANNAKIDLWSETLGRHTKPRIGLVWSGSPGHINDPNRSIPLSQFASLMSADAEFVSLQKDVRSSDTAALAKFSGLKHFGERLTDFSDTAALASLMDIVITVDTSVAHLAGALGRPTWLLLAPVTDWRWMVQREDCAWYPTMRIYRQPQWGNWADALASARQDLEALVAAAGRDKIRVR